MFGAPVVHISLIELHQRLLLDSQLAAANRLPVPPAFLSKVRPNDCEGCGAPVHQFVKCEYCGRPQR